MSHGQAGAGSELQGSDRLLHPGRAGYTVVPEVDGSEH